MELTYIVFSRMPDESYRHGRVMFEWIKMYLPKLFRQMKWFNTTHDKPAYCTAMGVILTSFFFLFPPVAATKLQPQQTWYTIKRKNITDHKS